MVEQKQRFSAATTKINDLNNLNDIDAALQELEAILNAFDKSGEFNVDGAPNVYRYGSQNKSDDDRAAQHESVAAVRLLIARNSLRLLQKTIPRLTAICDRSLELAGKDAIKAVCAPQQRQGTDWSGKQFEPTRSEFILPKKYQSITDTVISNFKAAIRE
jgi:hypothetical protein